MQLNIENIDRIKDEGLIKPENKLFQLPEKVLQFGTGVLLRGLPDYYIDKANRKGIFNGRIVVIKSTSAKGADVFDKQDGLYTVCIRGIEDGIVVEEDTINSSINRVINAASDWDLVLDAAANKNIRVIISNTTEAGIVESNDKLTDTPPISFPGKLLAVLYKRYETFPEAGFVILPTELISHNGDTLQKIVLQLAQRNTLPENFIHWLLTENLFCNTLVDRIVPGAYLNTQRSYEDPLMIMAEPFGLWAIESDNDKVKQILSFSTIDKGIVIVPSIEKYKEIKLRLLNGVHTLTCALAILAGFDTVRQSMSDPTFYQLVKSLLLEEIGPSILSETITQKDVQDFSLKVLDRFSNPFLEHKWSSIAANYTEKFKLRCIPILQKWYSKYHSVPELFALGMASYLKLLVSDNDKISDKWKDAIKMTWSTSANPIEQILKNSNIWGQDLSLYDGLVEKITFYMNNTASQDIIDIAKTLFSTTKLEHEK